MGGRIGWRWTLKSRRWTHKQVGDGKLIPLPQPPLGYILCNLERPGYSHNSPQQIGHCMHLPCSSLPARVNQYKNVFFRSMARSTGRKSTTVRFLNMCSNLRWHLFLKHFLPFLIISILHQNRFLAICLHSLDEIIAAKVCSDVCQNVILEPIEAFIKKIAQPI